MTNPKENTDLTDTIDIIFAEYDLGNIMLLEAMYRVEKLVHQARVDELKKASTQLDYSEPGEWFDARIKELESKEEA